jgi:hypothetical protein
LTMPTVQSKCFSCRRDPVPCDEHPNCAPGGPLAGLGMQLACRLCLVRLVGSWPLTEEGKHRWCVVCACETDDTSGMKRQAGMTMEEYTALLKSGMVDNGEGAALFTCEKPKCPGAWCALCILRHVGPEAMLDADTGARWECPPCAGLVPVSVPVAELGAALAFAFPASCLLRLSRLGGSSAGTAGAAPAPLSVSAPVVAAADAAAQGAALAFVSWLLVADAAPTLRVLRWCCRSGSALGSC